MPRFFVALAHTDNISRWKNREATEKSRVTNINLFPGRLRENLLFSLSFDSTIHYNTLGLDLDPLGAVKGLLPHTSGPKRVFADCGAFQFRASAEPKLDGELLTAKLAWDHYQENHLSHAYPWQEILLCSPDHIVTATMTHEEAEVRFAYIKQHAGPFLELCKAEPRVTAVGVIHGRNNKERAEQYLMFKSLGYRYVALGGMVPYASNTSAALNIIAGIRDLSDAWVEEGSILDMCRRDGIKLHIFGLNSPDWVRWWHRLEIDSFDGSKLSTEGAGNGWYYIPKDGKGHGRQFPTSPTSASDLFHRFPVKKMQSQRWNWCPAPEIGHSLWDIKYRENSAQVGRKKVLVSGTNIMINGVET
jgi:hypothetical protein